MKPRALTLQQKLGFNDVELTSPQHDKMILNLIRYKDIVAHYLMPKIEIDYNDRVISDKEIYSISENGYSGLIDETPKAITEVAIKSGSFVVGFIDLVFHKRSLRAWRNGSVVEIGFVDSYASKYAVEVKPTIRSFGETMRQIRHYQEYINIPIAIYTPDDSFTDAFNEQGVKCFGPDQLIEFLPQFLGSAKKQGLIE